MYCTWSCYRSSLKKDNVLHHDSPFFFSPCVQLWNVASGVASWPLQRIKICCSNYAFGSYCSCKPDPDLILLSSVPYVSFCTIILIWVIRNSSRLWWQSSLTECFMSLSSMTEISTLNICVGCSFCLLKKCLASSVDDQDVISEAGWGFWMHFLCHICPSSVTAREMKMVHRKVLFLPYLPQTRKAESSCHFRGLNISHFFLLKVIINPGDGDVACCQGMLTSQNWGELWVRWLF